MTEEYILLTYSKFLVLLQHNFICKLLITAQARYVQFTAFHLSHTDFSKYESFCELPCNNMESISCESCRVPRMLPCITSRGGRAAYSWRPLGVRSWSSTTPPSKSSFDSDFVVESRLEATEGSLPKAAAVQPLNRRAMFRYLVSWRTLAETLLGKTRILRLSLARLRRMLFHSLVFRSL